MNGCAMFTVVRHHEWMCYVGIDAITVGGCHEWMCQVGDDGITSDVP